MPIGTKLFSTTGLTNISGMLSCGKVVFCYGDFKEEEMSDELDVLADRPTDAGVRGGQGQTSEEVQYTGTRSFVELLVMIVITAVVAGVMYTC